MNAITRLFAPGVRDAAAIRKELEAITEPATHSEMVNRTDQARAALAGLTGEALKVGESRVAEQAAVDHAFAHTHKDRIARAAALADELTAATLAEKMAHVTALREEYKHEDSTTWAALLDAFEQAVAQRSAKATVIDQMAIEVGMGRSLAAGFHNSLELPSSLNTPAAKVNCRTRQLWTAVKALVPTIREELRLR